MKSKIIKQFIPFKVEIEIETPEEAYVLLHKLDANTSHAFGCNSNWPVPDDFNTSHLWFTINNKMNEMGFVEGNE